MIELENRLPGEELDAAEVVRGILKVQAAFAAAQKRPLGRGTHTKGICALATFEVFDLPKRFDPRLSERLAHGIFAHPGNYSATVRFANAASQIFPDRSPDLRALSIAVELPGQIAPGVSRQDFSLQNATTFPINDLHAFAVAMSVLSASSAAEKLRAIARLSPAELLGFLLTAMRGKQQSLPGTLPYQQIRYWSTVPFRNGPGEAAKFTAIPDPENPAHDPGSGPDALQEELLRHLNEDDSMSSFAIGIQLLEPQRMKRWGLRRKPSDWVENASVEWNEAQAPFHIVGRLTLRPKSALAPEACRAMSIDVTANCTPDSQPIGSVNRGRRAAEVASRKVRLGEATAAEILAQLPAPSRPSRLRLLGRAAGMAAQCAAACAVLALIAYFIAAAAYPHLAARNLPAPEHADRIVYLDQGWGLSDTSPDRQAFYYTPQGTDMHGVRYSWFVNLERPFSHTRFTSPDHMRALNFIVDPKPVTANPDRLPVGFTRHYDADIRDYVVDITCAACHTGQLYVKRNGVTTAVRIDGGEAMTAFTDTSLGSFQGELGASMIETLVNPAKFNRFAGKVLGSGNDTWKAKWALWQNMAQVSSGLLKVATGSSAHRLYPTQEGYGRTDALARIGNVVFGDHIARANYKVGDGPVSYPYLWNIWKFNWEQYTASVSQPMARNVGEALGVGADFALRDDYGRPLPPQERYRTSVSFDNLLRIESTLQKLSPPQWPQDVLGPIDRARAARGEVIFNQVCARCHGPHVASDAMRQATSPGRTADDAMWMIEPVSVNVIGTDPNTANNFAKNSVDLTPAGITRDDATRLLRQEYKTQQERMAGLAAALKQEKARRAAANPADPMIAEIDYEMKYAAPMTGAQIDETLNRMNPADLNTGQALNVLGLLIRERYYTQHNIAGAVQACYAGFGTLDLPLVFDGYKPRPLAGVWATPPFLHNGSVPNLYELLAPVSERSKKFFVGRRDFDPVKVGFATTPVDGSKNGFWFDTSLPGNRNTGHEFSAAYDPAHPQPGIIGPAFTPEQRYDIIEYLKIRQDNPPQPASWQPADCAAVAPSAAPGHAPAKGPATSSHLN